MATPVPDSYSAASGTAIYGGRIAPSSLWAGDVVVAGDSLTALTYPSASYRLALPLTLKPPRVIRNAGTANDTLQNMLDRWDADVTASGAAIVEFRGGTNGPGVGTYQDRYTDIFNKVLAASMKCIVLAVPPKGAGTSGVDSPIVAQNDWLAAYCAARPAYLRFIQDSTGLGDANYNAYAEYYIEGARIHMNGLGVVTQANARYAAYASILALADPRITSASDIYPANTSSNQWVQNPFMSGTGGTFYNASGVAPTGWAVNSSATGQAVASIVAADVGDANQTPWLRTQINAGTANGGVSVSTLLSNPVIDADPTAIKYLDVVAEIRLNALDTAAIGSLTMNVARAGVDVNKLLSVNIGNSGILTKRAVLRHSFARTQGGVTPIAYPANGLTLGISINFGTAVSAPIGSFDVRCASVRGSAA